MKPIVKWAGGKQQLLTQLTPYIPSSYLYVEPFVGGGAVWLHTHPEHAIINDSNQELINVYKVVRDTPDELIGLLEKHEKADSRDHFYKVRSWDRDSLTFLKLSNAERAARFIYLNKTCYNGMFRVNSAGQFNVPYGRYQHPNIVNETGIRALHDYLAGNDIGIRCGDYADVLKTSRTTLTSTWTLPICLCLERHLSLPIRLTGSTIKSRCGCVTGVFDFEPKASHSSNRIVTLQPSGNCIKIS